MSPIADEKIDIVATEDNTTITITPAVDIVGHDADVSFSITLNRGQTFSLENKNITKSCSLAGTHITSDKNIAITISDDSIDDIPNIPSPYDLIGDQTVPIDMIGTEYIAVKASDDPKTINKVFILATEDDTHVWLNNDITNIKYLNKGDVIDFDITNNAIYIKSTKPIYAYQLASLWNKNGNELGSAILPNIACTGSQWVSITRTFTDKFHIQLLTMKKNLDGFIFTDNKGKKLNYIDNANWQAVPGTGDENDDDTWYSTSMPLNISTSIPHILENTKGLFHVSILDENVGSVSYGYFSSYSTLIIHGLTEECLGNSVTLSTDKPMKSYQWFSENTGNTILSTDPTLDINESGKYWVTAEVNFGGCKIADTIDVNFYLPQVDLGTDTSSCVGETITLENKFKNEGTYLWKDNSTANTLDITTTNTSNKVWLQITGPNGCTNQDTIIVSSLPQPSLDLSKINADLCIGDSIINNTICEHYQWSVNGIENPADTLVYIKPIISGKYTLTGWNKEGCSITESIDITLHNLPIINFSDIIECSGLSRVISGPPNMASYKWNDNSTSEQITIIKPDTVWLKVKDNFGCVNSDTLEYKWYNKNTIDLISNKDTSICINGDITLKANKWQNNYSWQFEKNGTITDLNDNDENYTINNANSNDNGNYIVTAYDNNSCKLKDTIKVDVINFTPLSLGSDRSMCKGDTIKIESAQIYTLFNWTKKGEPAFSSNDPYINVYTSGTYTLNAETAEGCKSNNDITVTILTPPVVELYDDFKACPNTSFTLDIKQYTPSPGGNGIKSIIWNTGETQAPFTTKETGKHIIYVEDDNGCIAQDSITVSLYNIPNWGITEDTSNVCENTDKTLSVDKWMKSYLWQLDQNGTVTNLGTEYSYTINNAKQSDKGNYIISIEDNNGCKLKDTISIDIMPITPLNLGSDGAICKGHSLKVEGNPGYSIYSWTKNGDPNFSSSDTYINVTKEGTYILNAEMDNGCASQGKITVTVNEPPEISIQDTTTCPKSTFKLSYNNPYKTIKWSWDNGSANTPSITRQDSGRYTIYVEDNNGCITSDTINVKWYELSNWNIFDKETSVCINTNLTLDAGKGLNNYSWQLNKSDNSIKNLYNYTSTYTITNAQSTDEGKYIVFADDYNGCKRSDSIDVQVMKVPSLSLGSDGMICEGDTIQIESNPGFTKYRWTKDSDPTVISTDTYINIAADGTYNLEAEMDNGCKNQASINITTRKSPTVELPNDFSVCPNTPFHINIIDYTPSPGGEGAYKSVKWNTGDYEESIIKNTIGEYIVYVEDQNSCVAQDTVNVMWYNVPNSIIADDNTSVCVNTDITLNATPGLNNYSWKFIKNYITSDLSNTTSSNSIINAQEADEGQYIVFANDSHGCHIFDTIDVEVMKIPDLLLGHDGRRCIGDTIKIEGNPGYTSYSWTKDANPAVISTDFYINVAAGGVYNLEAEMDNGCINQASINITTRAAPSVQLDPDFTICPNKSFTIDTISFTPSPFEAGNSGNPIKSIRWSTDETNTPLINNKDGKYTIYVEDWNGCIAQDNITVSWYNTPNLKIDDTKINICENTNLTLNATTGLNNYSWKFVKEYTSTNLASTTSSHSIINANEDNEGNYIVYADDSNGCSLSDTIKIDVMSLPPLSLGSDRELCDGNTIRIYSNPQYTNNNWSKVGDPTFSSNNNFIDVTNAGTYSLEVDLDNGCITKSNVTVAVNPIPTVTFNNFSFCPNSTYKLDYTNPYSFIEWSTGEQTSSITVDKPGRYTIYVRNDKGCSNNDSFEANLYPLVNWRLNKDTAICNNTTIELQSPLSVPSEANSYQWATTAGISGPTNNNWTINKADDYILTITDLNNCTTDDTTSVSLLKAPTLNLGSDKTSCNGETIKLTTDESFDRYEWNNNPANNSPSFPVTTTGDINLTVWYSNGCYDSDTVNITVNPLPAIDLGNDLETCAGEQKTLTAPAGMVSYYWNTRDTTQSITVNKGTYNVKITDINGCSNYDTIIYIWRPVPHINLGNDTAICPVNTLILDAGKGYQGENYITYLWQNGATSPTIEADLVDTVNMVKVNNQYNCYSFDTKMVRFLPTPDYELSPDSFVCSNDSLLLDAGPGYVIYEWFDNSTDDYKYISTEGDNYWVKVFDGCFWMSDTMSLTVHPTPIITTIDTTTYSQIAIFPDGGTEPYKYAINDESFQDNNVFQNLSNGEYIVYVSDENNCMTEDTVTINGTGDIEVPNFFTPNGDGINDRWSITGIDRYPESIIKIYNRYGKLLVKYIASDQGWNGEYLNSPVPSDDYWYMIHLIPSDKLIKGHITIKR